MRKIFAGLVMVAVTVGASSCMRGDEVTDVTRWQDQIVEIDSYLAETGQTAVKDLTGVRMVITELGKGVPAKINGSVTSKVDVEYAGRFFPAGNQFDAGTLTNYDIKNLIDGWKVALVSLPEGSRAKIIIPSLYGYGSSGQGSIPGNTILEFDLNFKKLYRTTAELQQLGTDSVSIDNYLSSKGITAQKDTMGMRYVFSQPATGLRPGLYSKLSFHIAYKLLSDDTKIVAEFDASPLENFYNRAVDQTADGLKLGLLKMSRGSKATFYLPSLLAFGTVGATNGSTGNGSAVIPANAPIIAEVTLNDIQDPE